MPRGVPSAGFRKTKNFLASNKNSSNSSVGMAVVKTVTQETDEQIRAKLTERFNALEHMGEATIAGKNRAMIVSGPAGIGKSFKLMQLAEKYEKQGRKISYVRGFVRPTGLYKTFYEARAKNSVVIFDDTDCVFTDEQCLGFLKVACDMTRVRTLSWLAETNMEDSSGEPLPTQFDFEGSVIFITNYDFDWLINKGNKLAPHLQALISRSLYLDLAMKTRRDYLVRIQQVVEMGMLKESGLSQQQMNYIVKFIEKHADSLRELSLRMVVKLAQLYNIAPSQFESNARMTCFMSSHK